jgi:hypothetical protein
MAASCSSRSCARIAMVSLSLSATIWSTVDHSIICKFGRPLTSDLDWVSQDATLRGRKRRRRGGGDAYVVGGGGAARSRGASLSPSLLSVGRGRQGRQGRHILAIRNPGQLHRGEGAVRNARRLLIYTHTYPYTY